MFLGTGDIDPLTYSLANTRDALVFHVYGKDVSDAHLVDVRMVTAQVVAQIMPTLLPDLKRDPLLATATFGEESLTRAGVVSLLSFFGKVLAAAKPVTLADSLLQLWPRHSNFSAHAFYVKNAKDKDAPLWLSVFMREFDQWIEAAHVLDSPAACTLPCFFDWLDSRRKPANILAGLWRQKKKQQELGQSFFTVGLRLLAMSGVPSNDAATTHLRNFCGLAAVDEATIAGLVAEAHAAIANPKFRPAGAVIETAQAAQAVMQNLVRACPHLPFASTHSQTQPRSRLSVRSAQLPARARPPTSLMANSITASCHASRRTLAKADAERTCQTLVPCAIGRPRSAAGNWSAAMTTSRWTTRPKS